MCLHSYFPISFLKNITRDLWGLFPLLLHFHKSWGFFCLKGKVKILHKIKINSTRCLKAARIPFFSQPFSCKSFSMHNFIWGSECFNNLLLRRGSIILVSTSRFLTEQMKSKENCDTVSLSLANGFVENWCCDCYLYLVVNEAASWIMFQITFTL